MFKRISKLNFDRAKVRRILYIIIAVLSALAIILGSLCAVFYFAVERTSVEAGSVLTAAELTGDPEAYFCDGFDPEKLNHPGTYYIKVVSGGREREIEVTVVDTRAPKITVKSIKWPINAPRAPRAEDFIESVVEADTFSGEFVEALPEFKKMGSYFGKVVFADGSGNKTEELAVALELVSDSEAPKIKLLADEVAVCLLKEGDERPDFTQMVEITDNCAGETRIEIDDSEVDYGKVGRYYAYVMGYDMVGNKSERLTVKVEIVEEIVDED